MPRIDPVTGEEIPDTLPPANVPPLQPPPGAPPAAAPPAQPQRPWWQRFLQSGYALPLAAAIPHFIGRATGNQALAQGSAAFGTGAAEGALGNIRMKQKEAMARRQSQFEESQLRVRNLGTQIEKYRALASQAPSGRPEDAAADAAAVKAKAAIGVYDEAMADGTITDAEAKKVHEALLGVDWDALETKGAAERGARVAGAEFRARREAAAKELAGGLQPPPGAGVGWDAEGAARRLMSEAEVNKLRDTQGMDVTFDAEGKPILPQGTAVRMNPGEASAALGQWRMGKTQERIAAHQAASDAARRDTERDRINAEEGRQRRADMADRRARWARKHEAWQSGRQRPEEEPIDPEMQDNLDALAGQLGPERLPDVERDPTLNRAEKNYLKTRIQGRARGTVLLPPSAHAAGKPKK